MWGHNHNFFPEMRLDEYFYLNILTCHTSILRRHLVHGPTEAHRVTPGPRSSSSYCLALERCPEGSLPMNTSSCCLNFNQSECYPAVAIRMCTGRRSNNSPVSPPSLRTPRSCQASCALSSSLSGARASGLRRGWSKLPVT